MPYTKISQLPDSVQNHLPKHAQEIYLAAFNHAWEQYKSAKDRQSKEDDRETVAHKVAWSAVKTKYEKSNDKWVKKSSP